MDINSKDDQLINLLRENGRMNVAEISRRMCVSRTAAQMRLQKLERNETIKGYSVELSNQYLKSRVRALVMIKFPPSKRSQIEANLASITHVTSLYSISGSFDLAGIVSASDMESLDAVIDRIGCIKGIDETMSSIILSTKIDR